MENTSFGLRSLKMWRLIQISALLPLVLIGSLMVYFDQFSPFGIIAFLLTLVVGVIIPQMRGDMILSHFVLSRELEERVEHLEQRVTQLLTERDSDPPDRG
jgi:hypothetical protein